MLRLVELNAKVKGNHASMRRSTLAVYGSNSTEASNAVLSTRGRVWIPNEGVCLRAFSSMSFDTGASANHQIVLEFKIAGTEWLLANYLRA